MESLKHLYKIGRGPSSSHTMGPSFACLKLKEKYKNITSVKVTLFGSLAWTGKGHLTDVVIKEAFDYIPCEVVFDYKTEMPNFNTMVFDLTLDTNEVVKEEIYSVGGGSIRFANEEIHHHRDIYKENNLDEIIKVCKANNWRLYDYVYAHEGNEIKEYLRTVWRAMLDSINRGIHATGTLPGKLNVARKANLFLNPNHENESVSSKSYRLMSCYAFAVGEENASGGVVVTAPTCGSAATLPAVVKYMADQYNDDEDYIINALATAGIVGNCIKQNGSISGAEAGCQAEIGSACAMAAAALAEMRKYSLDQIEHSAEVALEHHLGLTCDPVDGYVQIPCIERNAVAASQAVMSCFIAEFSYQSKRVSFDVAVKTMLATGKDISNHYKETSLGGLASSLKNIEK